MDCIYLGTLLHHFYNERGMLIWDEVGNGWRITYAGDVVAEVGIQSQESLKVTIKEIILAEDNDRFIPLHEAITHTVKMGVTVTGDFHWIFRECRYRYLPCQ